MAGLSTTTTNTTTTTTTTTTYSNPIQTCLFNTSNCSPFSISISISKLLSIYPSIVNLLFRYLNAIFFQPSIFPPFLSPNYVSLMLAMTTGHIPRHLTPPFSDARPKHTPNFHGFTTWASSLEQVLILISPISFHISFDAGLLIVEILNCSEFIGVGSWRQFGSAEH